MKNNGISKDRYLYTLQFYIILIPTFAMVLFFIILMWAVCVRNATGVSIEAQSFKYGMMCTFLAIALLSFFIGVFILVFGPALYKRYACQVIDFDAEDIELESITLTDKKLRISYYEGRYLEHVDIEFARYGIKVRKNKACKMPTFLIEGNRVKKLILPDVIYPRPFYNEYKVIHDLFDDMLCV